MIDWQQIDTVILDMDGTLLDLNFDNQFWLKHVPSCYADHNGISFDDACKIIYPQMNSIRGTLDWYCIDFWSGQLGLDIGKMKSDLAHLIQARPGVFEFLRFLRQTGKRVWLATNAHPDTVTIKFKWVNLDPHLDRVICAHALGAPKESPDFWDRLNQISKFDPERSLFIDDNLTVLRTAREYGIRHLLAIRQPDLSAEVKEQVEFVALDHFNQITASRNSAVWNSPHCR